MNYFSQTMLHILHHELIRFAFLLRHCDGKPIILSQWVAPLKMQRAFCIVSRCLLPSASLHNSSLPIKFSSASPGSHLSQRQLGLGYAQLRGRSPRGDRSLSTWPWKKKDASRRDDTSIQRPWQPPKINVDFVQWHIPSSARKKKLPLQATAELRKPRSSCKTSKVLQSYYWTIPCTGTYTSYCPFLLAQTPSGILKAWTTSHLSCISSRAQSNATKVDPAQSHSCCSQSCTCRKFNTSEGAQGQPRLAIETLEIIFYSIKPSAKFFFLQICISMKDYRLHSHKRSQRVLLPLDGNYFATTNTPKSPYSETRDHLCWALGQYSRAPALKNTLRLHHIQADQQTENMGRHRYTINRSDLGLELYSASVN